MSLSFIVFIVYCLSYHCLSLQMCSSQTKYKYDKVEVFCQDSATNTHKYCSPAQSFRHCQLSLDEANTLSKPVRKKMSLSVYLAVSITITHSFPSRLHEYASSPEALYIRGRPTCFLQGAVSLFWEVQRMTNCI